MDVMQVFHPLVLRWFQTRFAAPTEIQRKAWPEIASGKHVLISAPTGTGKTLTVFLWAINRLIEGTWEPGALRVLYVSPLKALNTDIMENLLSPLSELRTLFEKEGASFPEIRVLTRSGDTPQSERRKMVRRPPEILITTPESLNLIISSPEARLVLATVKTVILDEIHSIASGKRGVHLITAVDRLVPLAGEFQRIAVSATVRPLATVAAFVGGFRAPAYEPREVAVIEAVESKSISLTVEYQERLPGAETGAAVWRRIADAIYEIISNHTATLVFVNSRRLAEQLTHLINEDRPLTAYAHHGSLSRELRRVVERKLKNGELSAIVATSSLEMGIDIGSLDVVVLVQTPFSVSSAVQRIGRSGHAVGRESRGVLFPSHGRDLVDAAVMAGLVRAKDVEEVRPVSCPLDMLAQILVSMLGIEAWNIDDLFCFLRTSYPFHQLRRADFDSVLEMLAGRYRATRIRELRQRVSIDRIDGTARAVDGALSLLYLNSGTIPERGYYKLRLRDSQALIGELDEEFVWERRIGDTFSLGTQSWKIIGIDHQKVEVVPWKGHVTASAFWKAEGYGRDFHLASRIGEFLESANEGSDAVRQLSNRHLLTEEAAKELLAFLERQKGATSADLPHRHHLLIEHTIDPGSGGELAQVFIHTMWGNRLNYPLVLALAALWEEEHLPVEFASSNDAVLFYLPRTQFVEEEESTLREVDFSSLLLRLTPENVERLLAGKLEGTGFFGSRFRENAARALLLPRFSIGKRMPLWITRLRAKKLYEKVSTHRNFPIVQETWRTCVQDEFDIDGLKRMLEELATGSIQISEVTTDAPSPFAAGNIWQVTNELMYEDDAPGRTANTGVDEEILREAVFGTAKRPRLPAELVSEFQGKLQRTAPGYAPRSARALIDWVTERILIPEGEWESLLAAVNRDLADRGKSGNPGQTVLRDKGEAGEDPAHERHEILPEEILQEAGSRLVRVTIPGAEASGIGSVESISRLCDAFSIPTDELDVDRVFGDTDGADLRSLIVMHPGADRTNEAEGQADGIAPEQLLSQWLSYYGPLSEREVGRLYGAGAVSTGDLLDELGSNGSIIRGSLTEGSSGTEVCDAVNFERLLAFARRRARTAFDPLPVNRLPLFLAAWQRVARKSSGSEGLKKVLTPLLGYPARAGAWEEEILPARMENYHSMWLDELFRDSELVWFGCGKESISFCLREDEELFVEEDLVSSHDDLRKLFPDRFARYSFWDMHARSSESSGSLASRLWSHLWEGVVRCDSFEVLRRGVLGGFRMPESREPAPRRGRRGAFAAWKSARPIMGAWYLPDLPQIYDLIEEEELRRERVRLLLRRYGVIFRELVVRELGPLRWSRLFRTLRLMELAGEIIGGYFFTEIPGLQFASHAALRFLKDGLPQDAVYWLSASDPASLCGIDIPALKAILPERFPSTWMVFRGSELVLTARKRGEELDFRCPPSDPHLLSYLDFFRVLVGRSFNPLSSVKVKLINGQPPEASAYGDSLLSFGFRKDYQGYSL